jgi:DNA modification methylase
VTFRDLYPDLGPNGWTPGRRSLAVGDATTYLEVGRGSKGSPVFNVHSYHTKVPPEAIEPFITHYTRPGATVLDPFAGSGMTGVAARRTGRKAILNDLAPAAAHIAWNVTHRCDAEALGAAAEKVLAQSRSLLAELYTAACGTCGQRASIAYTIWSDRLECPRCGNIVSVWDACADRVTGTVSASVHCPRCRASSPRRSCARRDRTPVWIATDCGTCGRTERAVTADDRSVETFWRSAPIPDWHPTTPIGADREMYIRSALGLQGISAVHHFYTPRNLRALAAMWAAIGREPDVRLRQALAVAFTNTAWHGTIMRRFNARGGQRPLTGTLYVPHLSSEVNVANVFSHKIRQLATFYRSEWRGAGDDPISVGIGSATQLDLPDASVDYVFTDPPFGSSIFYADCNLIWESWLGEFTDVADEAVVNRSLRPENGGKTVAQYRSLMTASFAEMRRVLRRTASMTVVFHSTDGSIWESIEAAASDADLSIVGATYLDKGQLSHKGYKGRSGTEDVAAYDVVLEMKPRRSKRARSLAAARRAEAAEILSMHLATLPPVGSNPKVDYQRTLPYLHSLLVQHHFNGDIGLSVGDYDTVRAVCAAHFEQDARGRWFLRSQAESAEHGGVTDGREAEACWAG